MPPECSAYGASSPSSSTASWAPAKSSLPVEAIVVGGYWCYERSCMRTWSKSGCSTTSIIIGDALPVVDVTFTGRAR